MASETLPCLDIWKRKKKPVKNEFRPIQNVKRPTLLECIFNKRYTDRSVYYFTSGTSVDKKSMRDVAEEPTPYWCPPDTEEFSYKVVYDVWRQRFREQEAAYDYTKRPNYRSRQTSDLLQRLYIPDDEVKEPKEPGLLEIDPTFFKIVEGRPIKEKLDIRNYVEDLRQKLKMRLKAGYQMDEVMQIEEKHIEVDRKLEELNEKQKLYFDTFFFECLEDDYQRAMTLLREADEELDKSIEKSDQLKELNKRLGPVNVAVYILEEKWRNRKMFQKLLYMISPMYWRKKHDYIHRKPGSTSSLVSVMSEIFERYRLPLSGPVPSLDALLDIFLEDITTGEEPLLYFTDPKELTKVFQEMELQYLNFLLHSEQLSKRILALQQGIGEVRHHFDTEYARIIGKIKDLKTSIEWEENRGLILEEEARKLLNGRFKKVVVADSSLKLYVFVEDVFESCIAPNDSKLGLYDMMREIELKMEALLLKLDHLPYEIVKAAETESYTEEVRAMKEAEEAEAKVKLKEKLEWRLRRLLEPPAYSRGKPLKPRSEPPPVKKKKPKPKKPLTEKEKDFLNFFTDYCHHVDNVQDYFPLKFY
ncbi:cilia- and flagella-associated protein 100-like [Periplaneta americana]|uniref:cilia- and flagella-associated protein 100-like n=1 Tax=Periplaneta americana TaxID=6978 RepID=UPI0037E89509